MLFYPKKYINRIEEITIEFLQKNKIKALILMIVRKKILFFATEFLTIFLRKWKCNYKFYTLVFTMSNNSPLM